MNAFSQPERQGLERMQGRSDTAAHPDPDLLTAFAEQRVTAGEREFVLSHISGCADCRELLALATEPLVEPVPEPVRKRGIWEWSAFHWGAVAATAVVVTMAVFLGSRDLNVQPKTEMNPMISERAPLRAQEPASSNVVSKLTAPSESSSAAPEAKVQRHLQQEVRIEKPRRDEDNRQIALNEGKEKSETGTSNLPQLAGATAAAPPSPAPLNGRNTVNLKVTGAATSSLDALQDSKKQDDKAGAVNPELAKKYEYSPGVAKSNAAFNNKDVMENVAVEPQRSASTPADTAQRAKTEPGASAMLARKAATAGALAAPYHSISPIRSEATGTTWQITREGILQRSFSYGGIWESILPDRKFRSVAVVREHIWAGGDNGLLFSSADNGRNWAQIAVHDQNASATGNFTRLLFEDDANGSLNTSTGETWSTNDAGHTWHKQ